MVSLDVTSHVGLPYGGSGEIMEPGPQPISRNEACLRERFSMRSVGLR